MQQEAYMAFYWNRVDLVEASDAQDPCNRVWIHNVVPWVLGADAPVAGEYSTKGERLVVIHMLGETPRDADEAMTSYGRSPLSVLCEELHDFLEPLAEEYALSAWPDDGDSVYVAVLFFSKRHVAAFERVVAAVNV
jgi:hypothetical protein